MCNLKIEDLVMSKAMNSQEMLSVRGGQAAPGTPQGAGMPGGTVMPDPMSMVTMPEGGPADFSTEGISSWVQQKIGAIGQSNADQPQPAPTQ